MPSNHLILCHPLLLLPSIFPSIRVFSNESALLIRWPKYGVSASTSVRPVNTQDWSLLEWTGWIFLQSKGLSRVFSNNTFQKHQLFGAQLFFVVQLSRPYMTVGKTIALNRRTFVDKVMSLLFNMLSRLVITFLPRSKHLLISVWNEMNEVTQSCPTFCDPMDCNLPGSSIHGIFQARVLEWVDISSPGDLPGPGIEPRFPALQADTLPSELPGKPFLKSLDSFSNDV